MNKKLLLIIFIACFVFALNVNVSAADAKAKSTRKAGGFDRSRPNNFTESMKKIGLYVLLYIPNRLVDATDIFTVDASIGVDFAIEFQATRYLQIGGSYGENYFLAKNYARQYGVGHKETKHYGFIAMEKDITFVNDTSGTVREFVIDFPEFAVANYHLDAFQDNDEDFWKLGGRVGWVLGFGFGIHPVEIVDFVLGFVWIDIMDDDF